MVASSSVKCSQCNDLSLYVITFSTICTRPPFLTRAEFIHVTCFTIWRTEKGTAFTVITFWVSWNNQKICYYYSISTGELINVKNISTKKKYVSQLLQCVPIYPSSQPLRHIPLRGSQVVSFMQWLLQVLLQFIPKTPFEHSIIYELHKQIQCRCVVCQN